MSNTVDNRVLEMRFDNSQFESNVKTSISTLDKLKQSLNLQGASKGLDGVSNAAKRFDLSPLGSAIETVQAKFSALQVVGVTALANITNSAINTGKRMISALTIDPIKTGFQEYETQINAVQTILANTSNKGTTIDQVNEALLELNHYADKTIYNFTEMTKNIGTFTAAGVGLKESTSAIQGIANLAAVSGSTSQQASTAMYQLSQALAAGTVKLMDWNSVVNAGMGGEVFQEALKKTARAHGVAVDEMIAKNGSFRESLQEGWITSEILTETLSKMTKSGAAEYLSNLTGVSQDQIKTAQELVEENKNGKASYDELAETLSKTGKISKDEALDILKMADTAEDAATKVKTFTQLWDTLKEAAQSGWTQSWEIIIGDFEEAKELLSSISEVLSDIINQSSEARNTVLQGWKKLGGRKDLIDSFKNIFDALVSIAKPIQEAFAEIIPPITSKRLFEFTQSLKEFTSGLKLSSFESDNLKNTFKGLFSIVHLIGSAFGVAFKAIAGLLPILRIIGDGILFVTGTIGSWIAALDIAITKTHSFKTVGDGIHSFLIGIAEGIRNFFTGISNGFQGFGEGVASIGEKIGNAARTIWESLKSVFEFIKENLSLGDIFAGLAGGGVILILKNLLDAVRNLKEGIGNGLLGILFGSGGEKNVGKAKDTFRDVLESVNDSLQAFTTGIRISSLVSIAAAIGILAASLKTISQLDIGDVAKSLTAMGIMFAMLTTSFKSLTKTLNAFNSKGIVKTGLALMMVAESIKILSESMSILSALSWNEIAKGLSGIGGALIELSVALKIIDKVKVPLRTSIAMIALAESCKLLSDAFSKFGGMSWSGIARGLTGMGTALTEFVATITILSKVGGFKSLIGSASLLIAVQSLGKLAEAFKSFGSMSWDEIKRGLVGMGGALAEVSVITGALGMISSFSGLLGAGSIFIVVQGLSDLAKAFQSFGKMSWGEIARGLAGMGGALAEVAVITGALGMISSFAGILGAGTITIVVTSLSELAEAFGKFGEMSWDEVGRGLVGMGGALAEVAGISGALGMIAGFAGLLGAGTILLAVQSLGDLASAFKTFGEMTWDEIGRGLVGMGGALTEVSVICGALGAIAGLPALLGGGAILLAVQGLGDLADALKKFGEMNWDEIGRGLTAMGAALGEVALGSVLNTLSGFGASAITEVSASLGVLADSVKKWATVTVPDNLGEQLGILAQGIGAFTFGGFGASALAEAAPAVGIMADSVTKWAGVTVPENLGTQIGSLAEGVAAFTFGGFGAGALAEAAPAVGTMAESVKKWAGVTVPESLNSQLQGLAEGVKAFTWAFMGGWSLDALAGPLGDLAGSIQKWSGVSIPSSLGDQLSGLAEGVKKFSFAFASGWSLSAITGPLGDLSDSVKRWNGVSIPAGLGDQLKNLASGVKSFNAVGNLDAAASGFESLASSVKKLSGVNFGSIASGLTGLVDAAKSLSSASGTFATIGETIVNGIVTPIQNGAGKASAAIQTMINSMSSSALASAPLFLVAGTLISTNLASGISAGSGAVVSAASSLISSCRSTIASGTSGFWSLGYSVAQGFANGISAGSFMAAAQASAMAAQAASAARAALDINSPSKVFRKIGTSVPEGFAQGIGKLGNLVRSSSENMAQNALDGTKKAISTISDIVNDNINAQPIIRPVLDLSGVKNKANLIGNMLGNGTSIGVAANVGYINNMMNRRNQVGSNDDVVSALDKLRVEVRNIEKPSYNIDRIMYDDGSNIASAVESLVRAAKVERRI